MPEENRVSLIERLSRLPAAVWLMMIFAVLTVLKSYWLYHTTGPTYFYDEMLYKQNAEFIFKGQLFRDSVYPPLYSIFLSPAFFSKGRWYEWMIFINILLSSAVIFPVYLISKSLLPKPVSFLPVVIAALLPFQAVYPSMLLSENLFLPLFLFAIYFSLRNDGKGWASGMPVGVLLAFCYLTKYLFLPAIPLLLFVWWVIPLLNKDFEGKSIREKLQIKRLTAAIAGFLIAYLPWLIYAHYSGISVGNAMGLWYVDSYKKGIEKGIEIGLLTVNRASPDIGSLVLWVGAYGAYLTLAIAPFLCILFLYTTGFLFRKSGIELRERIFFFTVIALSLGYFLIAIQHSWSAEYNYPKPLYLIGRYLMFLTPLYIIGATIGLYRLSSNIGQPTNRKIITASLISLILVYFAQRLLYGQLIWRLPGWFADIPFNSPDSFIYKRQFPLLIVLLTIFLTGMFLMAGRMKNILGSRRTLPFVAGLLIIFQLSVFYNVCQRTMRPASWPLHGRILAPIFNKEFDEGVKSIAVVYDIPRLSASNFLHSLGFWNVPEAKVQLMPFGELPNKISPVAKRYFLSSTRYDHPYAFAYDIGDTRFYLYDTNQKDMRIPPPVLEDFGPRSTIAGKGFNIQASGHSVLWLHTRYATSTTVVTFDDRELETTVGSDYFLSAHVPDKLFRIPAEHHVCLLDKTSGMKSNCMVFKVR